MKFILALTAFLTGAVAFAAVTSFVFHWPAAVNGIAGLVYGMLAMPIVLKAFRVL
jgi:hypothetical protein